MLRLICQSLRQRKNKSILLIIQFMVGFIALLFGLSSIDNALEYRRRVEQLAPLSAVHMYFDDKDYTIEYNSEVKQQTLKRYHDIFEKVRELSAIDRLGMFEEINTYEGNVDDLTSGYWIHMLNQEMLEMLDFKLKKGSTGRLIDSMSDNSIMPVIVSSSLEKRYKLGEVYCLYYISDVGRQEIKIEVVGVLNASVRFWDCTPANTVRGEDIIIVPQFKEFGSDIAYSMNSLLTFRGSDADRAEGLEEIQQIFAEEGITVQYETLEETVDAYYEMQKVVIMATTVFASILLILSLLGCIGAVLASITARYKEFGVYYALGFTSKDMMYLVGGEIVAVFGIALVAAVFVSEILFLFFLSEYGFFIRIPTICAAFLLMLCCSVLCVIMPIRKLKRLEPVEMMNGKEK